MFLFSLITFQNYSQSYATIESVLINGLGKNKNKTWNYAARFVGYVLDLFSDVCKEL